MLHRLHCDCAGLTSVETMPHMVRAHSLSPVRNAFAGDVRRSRGTLTYVSKPNTAPALLVIEDDRALREMLATLFTEEGYRVDTAHDGQQGRSCSWDRFVGPLTGDDAGTGRETLE